MMSKKPVRLGKAETITKDDGKENFWISTITILVLIFLVILFFAICFMMQGPTMGYF